MPDYVKRMMDEYKELDTKCKALEVFIESSQFDELDKRNRVLLCQQIAHMKAYRATLDARLWIAHGNK